MEFETPFIRDYMTPERRIGLLARVLPELVFYGRIARIVLKASPRAKAGEYDDRAWIGSSLATVKAIEAVGGRVVVENIAALSKSSGPKVIVGNHMSTLETFVLPGILRPHGPVTFIVKRQLVEMPVFKHIMISRNPVVVGRASPREDLKTMIEEGVARLQAGITLVVFPQTTRAASFTPDEFNSIAVKLARRAGVPLIPLALRTDLWGMGAMIKDVGPVHADLPVRFAFGEPMEVTGNGREQHEKVMEFITGRMQAWGVPVHSSRAEGGEGPTV